MFRRLLAAAATLALLSPIACAETADQVVAQYVKAMGGMEKIKSVRTVRMTGKIVMGQGMEAGFTHFSRRPMSMRTEIVIQGMTGVQAFDGATAWGFMPFMGQKEPQAAGPEDSKRNEEQADIDGSLVDWKAKGHRIELAGRDTVAGSEAWKLKLTLKDGRVRHYSIDSKSGLLVKVEGSNISNGTVVEFENLMSDYRNVEGRMFPFVVEGGAKGSPMRQKVVLDKVEVNVELPDTLFAVPANAVYPTKGVEAPGTTSPAETLKTVPDRGVKKGAERK